MLKLLFLIQYVQLTVANDYIYQQFIECHQQNCAPQDNGFIIRILQNFTKEYKLQQLNQLIPQFTSIRMEIKETANAGLGAFLKQNIKPYENIFWYSYRNTIRGGQINQKMFKQNSYTKQHYKIRINKMNLGKFYKDIKLLKDQMFYINLFYNFCRFEDSFLRNDIIGLPSKLSFPLFQITSHELSLIEDRRNIYNKIIDYRLDIVKEYKRFIKNLNKLLTKEQFVYYFSSEEFSFDDYLYTIFINRSRNHFIKNQNLLLVPILHYLNQEDNIVFQQNLFKTYFHKKKLYFKNHKNYHFENSEFVQNYNYEQFDFYVFQGGFVPHIRGIKCLNFKLIDQLEALQNNIDAYDCIDDNTIRKFSKYLMKKLDPKNFQECVSSSKLKQQLEANQNEDELWYMLWKECYAKSNQIKNNPYDIWKTLIADINLQINNYQNHISNLIEYKQLQISQNQEYSMVQLLIDYQSYYLDLAQQSLNKLQNEYQIQ